MLVGGRVILAKLALASSEQRKGQLKHLIPLKFLLALMQSSKSLTSTLLQREGLMVTQNGFNNKKTPHNFSVFSSSLLSIETLLYNYNLYLRGYNIISTPFSERYIKDNLRLKTKQG